MDESNYIPWDFFLLLALVFGALIACIIAINVYKARQRNRLTSTTKDYYKPANQGGGDSHRHHRK